MTGERKIEFKFGELELVLTPRLDAADGAWMNSLRDRRQQFTQAEGLEVMGKAIELLVKCARDHSPTLTKEEVVDELPADEAAWGGVMESIAIALLQVSGVIPTDAV